MHRRPGHTYSQITELPHSRAAYRMYRPYRLNRFEPRPYNRNVPLSSFCLNINFSFDIIHMSEYDFMLEYYLGGLEVKIQILLVISALKDCTRHAKV